jgi:hypothetical protein
VLEELGLSGLRQPGWITDPDRLADLLESAAFRDVRVIADTYAFHYADLDRYWQNALGTGLRRYLDALDAEQTAHVRAVLAERVRPHQRPDGLHLAATALLATARWA